MKADDEAVPAAPSRHQTRKEVTVMSKGNGKSSQVTRVKKLILGAKKHFPNASTDLQVGGATFTVTALTQLMQDFVDQREAVGAAKAATRANAQAELFPAPSQLPSV